MKSLFALATLSLSLTSLAGTNLEFSRDNRMADGCLVVTKVKNIGGAGPTSVSVKSTCPKPMIGTETTKTEFEEPAMLCKVSRDYLGKIFVVGCLADNRISDGGTAELSIMINNKNLYDVNLKETFYSMETGRQVRRARVIARDLIRVK